MKLVSSCQNTPSNEGMWFGKEQQWISWANIRTWAATPSDVLLLHKLLNWAIQCTVPHLIPGWPPWKACTRKERAGEAKYGNLFHGNCAGQCGILPLLCISDLQFFSHLSPHSSTPQRNYFPHGGRKLMITIHMIWCPSWMQWVTNAFEKAHKTEYG